jgi:hypothetical protein
MNQIFGDYCEQLPDTQEYIIVGFSPSSVPLKQRWRNNGLSADFLADYLMTFFPDAGGNLATATPPAEIKGAVSYISNELLENAMKFSDDTTVYPISVQLRLLPDRLIFVLKNSIAPEEVASFQAFLAELTSADPQELYLAQLEKNAMTENNTHSRLGYLTMMTDYDAKLGWKFEEVQESPPIVSVATMVTLMV